jgi:protein TonB
MSQPGQPHPSKAGIDAPSAPTRAMDRPMFVQAEPPRQLREAVGAGIIAHSLFLGLILLIGSLIPERVYQAVIPDKLPDLVWIAVPGPGGGGGGGGNKSPDPPKKVELPKPPEKASPPVELPKPEPPKPEPPPPPEAPIPAQTLNPPPEALPGVLESTQASTSLGTGTGGGGGTGAGTGVGQGQGAGLGAGTDRGVGGGAYRPGNGVVSPRVLKEVRPAYTAEAMRARVQGVVMVECVVLPDGSVGRVEVVKSLDSTFGLDQEAVKAAKQWRFSPGTRFGEPVPVLVTIELAFSVR